MRRADRLFQIIQFLRTRRITTAKWLSEKLEVSERTIYRDIGDLMISGVPIEGEAGVGYILRKEYNLPPLMFDLDEIVSLVIGIRMASSLGGKVKKSAEKALSKLNSALPKQQQQQIANIHIYAPHFPKTRYGTLVERLNQAICEKRVISISYQKLQDSSDNLLSSRKIYPLGIFFWDDVWTMAGWCLLRNDFRNFRLDRIKSYILLDEKFTLTREQSLQTFFSQVIPKKQRS